MEENIKQAKERVNEEIRKKIRKRRVDKKAVIL